MKRVGRGRIIKTYLGVSGHFDASVQELIKVLAELPGGGGQLAAGSARGVDDLACRVVEFSRGVVQISLRLLECFMAGWELRGDGRTRTQTRKLMHFSMPWADKQHELLAGDPLLKPTDNICKETSAFIIVFYTFVCYSTLVAFRMRNLLTNMLIIMGTLL